MNEANQTARTKMLIGTGREQAVKWMAAAITTAKDSEQLTNQMLCLSAAGVHVLATEAFNRIKQFGTARETVLEQMFVLIRTELAMIETEFNNHGEEAVPLYLPGDKPELNKEISQ